MSLYYVEKGEITDAEFYELWKEAFRLDAQNHGP